MPMISGSFSFKTELITGSGMLKITGFNEVATPPVGNLALEIATKMLDAGYWLKPVLQITEVDGVKSAPEVVLDFDAIDPVSMPKDIAMIQALADSAIDHIQDNAEFVMPLSGTGKGITTGAGIGAGGAIPGPVTTAVTGTSTVILDPNTGAQPAGNGWIK